MATSTASPGRYFGYTVTAPIPGVRTHHGIFVNQPEDFQKMVREATEAPFVGITSDGDVVEGVYPLQPTGIDHGDTVRSANEFLDSIDQPDLRMFVQQPVDHWQRRAWFNGSPLWFPEGILIDDLTPEQRDAVMDMARHTLGPAGYEMMRNAMRVTEATGKVWNLYRETMREFAVWVTVWGEPNTDGRPWGFQLMGLHVVVNALFVGDQLVLEPLFFGAELKIVDRGPHEGLQMFEEEEQAALALGETLTAEQREKAVTYPSMKIADLPPERAGFIDGRHIAGSGRDNRVIPYEGITARELTDEQRRLLVDLIEVYLARLPDGHREQRRDQIMRFFDDTFISWIGDPSEMPFYYRIQSPALIIEFDHHPGLMFEPPPEAIPEHVHTLMRMPNGGDYGFALLKQWEEQQAATG